MGFPGRASDKELTCNARDVKRHQFDPWVGKSPWSIAQQPTPVFLPRKSHGQRSLAGYSPQGCKTLDVTEVTQHAMHKYKYTHICTRACLVPQMVKNLPEMQDLGSIPGSGRSPGEGNCNPHQYSYLENSMDRGAWRAIVHGVAKSQTQMHRHTQLIVLLELLF